MASPIPSNQSNQLSEQLLLAVKMQEDADNQTDQLARMTLRQLCSDLFDDHQKKAFWINCYNAFFQLLRSRKKLQRPAIFTTKTITIAGQQFSLDDIEHGILRRYRFKFSLGYLPNPFASSLIKKLAVEHVDYRIHFALNCGAQSCPPIAFYTAEKVDQQLAMATLSFLESETDVIPEKKEIHISRLFQWFAGDFGGTSGVRKILQEKLKIDTKGFRLVYKKYSWEEQLENYVENKFQP